jgi:outer membrane protein assembly factor BamA
LPVFKLKKLFLFLILLIPVNRGFAYEDITDSIYKALLNPKYIIVPAFAYSSETNFVFGMGLYINPGVSDRKSNYFLFDSVVKYSLKKQFELHLRPTYRFGSWQTEIDTKLRKWPDTFYGIGNLTSQDAAEDYTTDKYMLKFNLFRDFSKSLSVGLSTDWEHYNFSKLEPEGLLHAGNVPGAEASEVAGLGAILRFDNTDAPYFPYSGFRFQFDVLNFDYRSAQLLFYL